jgi:hypothetical protein
MKKRKKLFRSSVIQENIDMGLSFDFHMYVVDEGISWKAHKRST